MKNKIPKNTNLADIINDYSDIYNLMVQSIKSKDKGAINEALKCFKAQNLLGKSIRFL